MSAVLCGWCAVSSRWCSGVLCSWCTGVQYSLTFFQLIADAGCLYGINVLKLKNVVKYLDKLLEAAKCKKGDTVTQIEGDHRRKMEETLDGNLHEGE